MATTDEKLRASAARFDIEMRFFVGGKWTDVDLDNIEAGQPYTPTVETQLAAHVDEDDTTITVDSTTGFSTGTFVIQPNTDGTTYYEIVKYTSKDATHFYGCTRQPVLDNDPASRMHFENDVVSEWYEITEWVLNGQDQERLEEGIGSWSVSLSGVFYNSRILDNDNAVLCLARFRPGAGGSLTVWTSWATYWFGFIRDMRVGDEADAGYAWTAVVEPWSQYLESTDAEASTYGRTDLAESKSVSVSSTIVDPFTEAASGEFIGSPEMTGEKAVDGDSMSLWMSEGQPVSDDYGVHTDCGIRINELYLRPAPGMVAGLQWIELVFHSSDDEKRWYPRFYSLCNEQSLFQEYDSSCPPEDPNCLPTYPAVYNNYIKLSDEDEGLELAPGEFLILTSNRPAFMERWGDTGAKAVLDWRDRIVGSFTISPTSGKLGLFFFGASCEDDVFWGAQAQGAWYTTANFTEPDKWAGSNLPAGDDTNMPAGTSYRLNPDGMDDNANDADNWKLRVSTPMYAEYHPTPGKMARSADPEWLSVDLGTMGVTLAEYLPSGQVTYIKVSGTLGFTNSGRVQIDFEQIDYATRDDGNNKLLTLTRGVGGTSAANHNAGAAVKQVESGTAYDAYQVDQVFWKRRMVSGAVPSVPKNFDIFLTTLSNPIYPDDEDWEDDWDLYWTQQVIVTDYSASGNVAVVWRKTFTPVRARHVMIVIHEMTDQGRAKLNEFGVFPPIQAGEDINRTGDAAYDLLVDKFGIPAAHVELDDPGVPFPGLAVTQQTYMAVLTDLMKRSGCMLLFGRDLKVYHRYDPRYPISMWPAIEIDWTKDNAQRCDLVRPFRHTVKQVVLRATEPVLEDIYEVTYPATPLRLGTIMQVEDMIAGDMDVAQLKAIMLFRRSNGILTATIQPVGIAEWVHVGQRHTVTWVLDTEGTYLAGRNFVVTNVSRNWSFGAKDKDPTWSVGIELEELIL